MKAQKQMTRDEALSIVNAISHPVPPTPVADTPPATDPSAVPITLTDSLDLIEKRIAILNGWLIELENLAAKLNARI